MGNRKTKQTSLFEGASEEKPANASVSEDISGKKIEDRRETVFSVAEFVDYLNEVLTPQKVIVRGEIFGNVNRRGAANYFTIKDKEKEVVLSCFAWQNVVSAVGTQLGEGMEVKIAGYPKVYPPSGRLNLQAEEILLSGEGALKKALEELKRKLEQEGLFDPKYKKPLPKFNKKIGLITAKGREAQKDFLTHLGTWGFRISFYDVRVEGMNAVSQVSQAIDWFNKYRPETEVLVLTRGGGSLESLQAFNSEAIARSIFASKIPVVCGVGHENDFSIADNIADIRASTPTHAAKILTEDWQKAEWQIDNLTQSLSAHFSETISRYQRSLDGLLSQFRFSFQKNLEKFRKAENELVYNFKNFASQIKSVFSELKYYQGYILQNGKSYLSSVRFKINQNEEKLKLSSPDLKLKQGYSIALDSKKQLVVKSVKDIKRGDELDIKFYDGKAITKVQNIK